MSCGHVIMGRSNGHFIHADLEKRIGVFLLLWWMNLKIGEHLDMQISYKILRLKLSRESYFMSGEQGAMSHKRDAMSDGQRNFYI